MTNLSNVSWIRIDDLNCLIDGAERAVSNRLEVSDSETTEKIIALSKTGIRLIVGYFATSLGHTAIAWLVPTTLGSSAIIGKSVFVLKVAILLAS